MSGLSRSRAGSGTRGGRHGGQLWASVVMTEPLAAGFGQETGHVFGLEPAEDPHFDPTVQAMHSRTTRSTPRSPSLASTSN
jgi:hypothetical protein